MGRTLTSHNTTEVGKVLTQPYHLVKIGFTSGGVYYSTLYDTLYDGDNYLANRKVQVGRIKFDPNGTQSTSLKFGDADDAMTALFIAESNTDIAVEIYKLYGEPTEPITVASNEAVPVFIGVINDRVCSQDSVSVQCISTGARKFSPGIVIDSSICSFLPAGGTVITSGTTTITLRSRY